MSGTIYEVNDGSTMLADVDILEAHTRQEGNFDRSLPMIDTLSRAEIASTPSLSPVSYTHLTLPTIYSV